MLGFKLAIYLQHGLCPFPKICIDDGRDRALDADIISAAGINAPIHFILDDAGDTAFIKGVALACAFTCSIELRHNGCAALPGGVMLKDKAHSGGCFFINNKALVFIGGQAKSAAAANSLAFQRAFPHAAAHLLRQLGGVILGKRLHQALDDDTLRTFHVAFGSVHDLYPIIPQLLFINSAVIAVPGKAVDFPADNGIKCAFAAVLDHLLEGGTVIGLAGNMAVDILMKDGHPVKFGESFTVTALPFDALFRLAAAARITIVGDEAAVPIDIFFYVS